MKHSFLTFSRNTFYLVLLLTCLLFSVAPANLSGESADMSKPVQVFIIMGQSNTLEMGRVKGDKEGSLEYAVKSEKLYPFMVDGSGNWNKRMDVRNVHTQGSGGPGGRGGVRRNDWLTVSGGKIGIEQGIGHHLGDALDAEKYLRLRGGIVGHGHRQRPDFTLVQVRVIRRWAS